MFKLPREGSLYLTNKENMTLLVSSEAVESNLYNLRPKLSVLYFGLRKKRKYPFFNSKFNCTLLVQNVFGDVLCFSVKIIRTNSCKLRMWAFWFMFYIPYII